MTLLKLCEMDQSIYIEQLLSNVNPDANNTPIKKFIYTSSAVTLYPS